MKNVQTIENNMTEYDLPFNLRLAIQDASKIATIQAKSYSSGTQWNYKIVNEEVLSTLTQLFEQTNNKYVIGVLETVISNQYFTENQIRVIAEELSKNKTITINF